MGLLIQHTHTHTHTPPTTVQTAKGLKHESGQASESSCKFVKIWRTHANFSRSRETLQVKHPKFFNIKTVIKGFGKDL